MKNMILAAVFALGVCASIEAAPTDTVTQADLQALIQRLNKLEAENKAQAAKIAELEGKQNAVAKKVETKKVDVAVKDGKVVKADKGSEISESGKIVTTGSGKKYYLADATANIFEPLSESGLQITPYGYLVLEGVYMSHAGDLDWTTDCVRNPYSRAYNANTSTLSVQDSILGVQFDTPEVVGGWKYTGRAEFDLFGGNANEYGFHWRHLWVSAEHVDTGWSFLAGQTWHLWKMVTPNEIDGAWMENAGHPYRRSPQFRVTKKYAWEDSSLEIRAGIVKNGPGMGGDRDKDGVDDNSSTPMPLFEAAVVYDRVAPWQDDKRRWLAGIGGMYGQDRSRASYNDAWENYNSMMLMLAGQIPMGKFTLTGQFFGGENLGGVQAGVGQRVVFNQYGQGKEVQTFGGFADLAYEFNEKWSTAIGYGFDHPTIGNDYVSGTDGLSESITHNDRAYIAAFYRLTSNLKFGLEYARLNTRYAETAKYKGGDAYADRVQFTAFFDF